VGGAQAQIHERKYRLSKEYVSQDDFAKASGVDVQTIRAYTRFLRPYCEKKRKGKIRFISDL